MSEIGWYSLALTAGFLVWLGIRVTIKIRHWWENEVERWSDFMREVRQFFESFLPALYGIATVAVLLVGYYITKR